MLNFLCVYDVEFILCIGYFFCPYPHRSKAFNNLVSIQSAFNIGTDIFVVCISRYGVVPTFCYSFINNQANTFSVILSIRNPIRYIKFFTLFNCCCDFRNSICCDFRLRFFAFGRFCLRMSILCFGSVFAVVVWEKIGSFDTFSVPVSAVVVCVVSFANVLFSTVSVSVFSVNYSACVVSIKALLDELSATFMSGSL